LKLGKVKNEAGAEGAGAHAPLPFPFSFSGFHFSSFFLFRFLFPEDPGVPFPSFLFLFFPFLFLFHLQFPFSFSPASTRSGISSGMKRLKRASTCAIRKWKKEAAHVRPLTPGPLLRFAFAFLFRNPAPGCKSVFLFPFLFHFLFLSLPFPFPASFLGKFGEDLNAALGKIAQASPRPSHQSASLGKNAHGRWGGRASGQAKQP